MWMKMAGIIKPSEVWSDAYDVEIMREMGRRVIQRQKDVDGALGVMDLGESFLSGSNRRYRGNIVLGIMSQKVAQSLPEFRSRSSSDKHTQPISIKHGSMTLMMKT
jgi:hypothetical protein